MLKLQKKPYMRGDDVRRLQMDLKSLGYKITVDGTFGPQTDKFVRQFQTDHKLEVDGEAGPITLAAIAALVQAHANPKAALREKFLDNIEALYRDDVDYWYGANAYDKNDLARLNKLRSMSPDMIDADKYAFLKERVTQGKTTDACDCSGQPAGTFRHKLPEVYGSNFDTSANGFYKSLTVRKKLSEMVPGDLCFEVVGGKAVHVGVMVRDGSIQDASGAYFGIGRSALNKHILRNKKTGAMQQRQRWNAAGALKVFI